METTTAPVAPPACSQCGSHDLLWVEDDLFCNDCGTYSPQPAGAEADVRAFVAQFPTPNATLALDYCEAGTISWEAARDLFARALTAGLESVA